MQIELYSKLNEQLGSIEQAGSWLAKSGFFKCDRVEQGQALMLMCWSLRKSPFDLLRTHHIIDGQISKKTLVLLGEFRQTGGKHKWLKTGEDGKEAVGQFTYEGETIVVKYTIEDARLQGLIRPNSNWIKTPSNMLRARVISNAIGMLAPELLSSLESEEDGSQTPKAALNLSAAPTPKAEVYVEPPTPAPAPPKWPESKVPPKTIDIEPQLEAEPFNAATIEPEMPVSAMEPAVTIEPEIQLDPTVEKPIVSPRTETPSNAPTFNTLTPETVAELETILAENIIPVAQWMNKEKWLPAVSPELDLTKEPDAIKYLADNLHKLSHKRAQRILSQKMNFMRAVQHINP